MSPEPAEIGSKESIFLNIVKLGHLASWSSGDGSILPQMVGQYGKLGKRGKIRVSKTCQVVRIKVRVHSDMGPSRCKIPNYPARSWAEVFECILCVDAAFYGMPL